MHLTRLSLADYRQSQSDIVPRDLEGSSRRHGAGTKSNSFETTATGRRINAPHRSSILLLRDHEPDDQPEDIRTPQ